MEVGNRKEKVQVRYKYSSVCNKDLRREKMSWDDKTGNLPVKSLGWEGSYIENITSTHKP